MKKYLTIISLAILLASCGSSGSSADDDSDGGSGPSTVGQWARVNEDVMGSITADLADIESAANSYDLDAMAAACMSLGSSVSEAQSRQDIPDAEVQYEWASALDDYAAASDDCVDGVLNADPDAMDRAVAELSDGNAHIAAATEAMR